MRSSSAPVTAIEEASVRAADSDVDAVEADRPLQLAAAVRARLDAFASDPTTVAVVVDTLGRARRDGGIDFGSDRLALTATEREAITELLKPRIVDFVAFEMVDELQEVEGNVVIAAAEPAVVDGRLAVTSSILCGELCATSGANVIEQDPATGDWRLGEPVGPQAVS